MVCVILGSRFFKHYRVNKAAFSYLLQTLTNAPPVPKKSTAVPPVIKLCSCLRFFAEGELQKGVGSGYHAAIAQSTFGEALACLDVTCGC